MGFLNMGPIEIYVRVKDKDSLVKIELVAGHDEKTTHDILWESTGEYRMEAFQCGKHPSDCSIEKDPRILNPKHELTLLLLDSINNHHHHPVFLNTR